MGEYRELPADWWGIDVSDQDRMAVEQKARTDGGVSACSNSARVLAELGLRPSRELPATRTYYSMELTPLKQQKSGTRVCSMARAYIERERSTARDLGVSYRQAPCGI